MGETSICFGASPWQALAHHRDSDEAAGKPKATTLAASHRALLELSAVEAEVSRAVLEGLAAPDAPMTDLVRQRR